MDLITSSNFLLLFEFEVIILFINNIIFSILSIVLFICFLDKSCTILSSCYCDHVHSEEECINQFLTNGGGSVKAVDSFTYSLIKMRYLSIILAIASFVGAWIFYKKKNDKNKSK